MNLNQSLRDSLAAEESSTRPTPEEVAFFVDQAGMLGVYASQLLSVNTPGWIQEAAADYAREAAQFAFRAHPEWREQ